MSSVCFDLSQWLFRSSCHPTNFTGSTLFFLYILVILLVTTERLCELLVLCCMTSYLKQKSKFCCSHEGAGKTSTPLSSPLSNSTRDVSMEWRGWTPPVLSKTRPKFGISPSIEMRVRDIGFILVIFLLFSFLKPGFSDVSVGFCLVRNKTWIMGNELPLQFVPVFLCDLY